MFQRILLAYNGSKEGKTALLACAEIASFPNIETHFLAVAEYPAAPMFTMESIPFQSSVDDARERMREILDDGIDLLRRRGFSASGHLSIGEPVDEICRVAGEVKADLIVVGHTQKTSFDLRWWHGSVGKSLLDHAPCSVLVALTTM